jgi:hypothetical protein
MFVIAACRWTSNNDYWTHDGRENHTLKKVLIPQLLGETSVSTNVPLGRVTEDKAVEIRIVAERIQIVIVLGSHAEARLKV